VTPLHKKILEKCQVIPDEEYDGGDVNFAQCVIAGNAGRGRENQKLLPIISSLLEQNERLTSALTEACNGCVDQSDAFNANAKELERLASGGG
jgi:hypothetical protein